jgi:glucokinase
MGAHRSVLALDIGGTKVAAAIVSSDGKRREYRSVPLKGGQGAEAALREALDLAEVVLQAEKMRGGTPVAVGVSTKGLTREEGVDIASGPPGWSALSIPQRVRERFGNYPHVLLNDVRAGALAEMQWGELKGVANGLYVNLGTGVAAGLVVGGQLVDGAHGAAGEIGYIVPSLESLASYRPGNAPLEELVGGRAITTRSSRVLGERLTMKGLVTRAEGGGEACRLKELILDEVALWVANVSIVLDPSKIVVGGGFVKAGAQVWKRIDMVVRRVSPFPPDVVPAFCGADSSLLGAGSGALRLVERGGRQGPPRSTGAESGGSEAASHPRHDA